MHFITISRRGTGPAYNAGIVEGAVPLVIVNPRSRAGRGARDWPAAAAALRAHFGPFQCRFTERPGHAATLAREASSSGRRLVLAFGGDGTLSEVGRGILASGQPSALGILPHGTGGDLARTLAVPTRAADAARAIRKGRVVAIDVGRVRFADGRERFFLNSASFGLSAEVAARLNRAHQSAANAAGYARQTIEAALRFEAPTVELQAASRQRRRLTVTTVSLHNGRFFGGGMQMAPGASVTDGVLDAVIVKKLPLARLLARAPLLYWGAHLHLDEVEHGSVRSLDAWPAAPGGLVPLEIDGETGFALPARFEVVPRALRIVLPAVTL